MRGLKLPTALFINFLDYVAPPTGAWIETSLSMFYLVILYVAPPTGAWIETPDAETTVPTYQVAPPTGAWIETTIKVINDQKGKCRTPYGCVD